MSPIVNSYRSGPRMALDIEGLDATSSMLLEAAGRGEDMRPALQRVKGVLIEGHKQQFESKGSHFGTPWPENSSETIARKAREGVPSLMDTLVAGGGLQEALAGGPGSRTNVSRGSVRVGVSLFEAIFAQGGASGRRRGSEPARPILGIGDRERSLSLRIVTDYLLGRP